MNDIASGGGGGGAGYWGGGAGGGGAGGASYVVDTSGYPFRSRWVAPTYGLADFEAQPYVTITPVS